MCGSSKLYCDRRQVTHFGRQCPNLRKFRASLMMMMILASRQRRLLRETSRRASQLSWQVSTPMEEEEFAAAFAVVQGAAEVSKL